MPKETAFDSRTDTLDHINIVRSFMQIFIEHLRNRAYDHDKSKLVSPEKDAFDILTPRLKGLTYGSDEYRACLKEMKPAIEHHYSVNTHHPEHYPLWKCSICSGVFTSEQAPETTVVKEHPRLCPTCCGPVGSIYESQLDPYVSVDGMDLLDVVEMLCDWKAAGMRHTDGDILKSLEINRERFELSDQMYSVMVNTAKRLGWVAP